MIEKIRYRLVYNRKKQLNKQGTALVQIEASLNQRKVYMKTNVYLRPECWSKDGAQVVNHPQANELNAMLYEYILDIQAIEIDHWKRGIEVTLSTIKEAVRKGIRPCVSFIKFSKSVIQESDRKEATKENMMNTVKALKEFRPSIGFSDVNYAFLKEFDRHLREKGLHANTIAKHMRILRTLVNEAIKENYITQEAYPFKKFKIKKEKKEHHFLTPEDLSKLEGLKLPDKKNNHRRVLDSFLFCCYCGLRFSDFKQLTYKNIISIDGNRWLSMTSIKTGYKLSIPLYLLFSGKALRVLDKYGNVEELVRIGCNADTNRTLRTLGKMAGIEKKFTYHTSRHTCATLLVHQGVPITTVQRILGHTSVRTTQIYSEVMDETMTNDLAKANEKVRKNRRKRRESDKKMPISVES